MAHAFGKTLLSVAAAFVAATSLGAQEKSTFAKAVHEQRLGNAEAAKGLFAQVLSEDPSNAEALALYRATSEDVWEMLLTNDDEQVRKIAQLLLDRAKAESIDQSRDPEAADALAATAVNGVDFGARKAASLQLSREHGEFGVAALLKQAAFR